MTRVVLAILLLVQAVFGPALALREQRLQQSVQVAVAQACVCAEGACECCCCCESCPMPEAPAPRGSSCRCPTTLATPNVVVAQIERKRDPPVRREMIKARGPAAFAQRAHVRIAHEQPQTAVAGHPRASIVWTGKRTT